MSTKKFNNSDEKPALKSFADHLGEMRTRLAWVALVFIVASALAYNVREQLVSIVLSPIGHQKLVYLTPAGGFAFIFQISMYAGLLATAPIAIYHLYRFISPALPGHMRRKSVQIVLASSVLLLLGVSFGYYVAIPAALQFLTTFGGDFVTANLTADSYLGFVIAYLLGLGLLFQLPLLLVLWNWVQPLKPGGLLASQRYVVVGSFIAAAMITPTPDALNQCLIAVPIVGIYQIGVVAVYLINRRKSRREYQLAQRRDYARRASEAFMQSRQEGVTPQPVVQAQPVVIDSPKTPPVRVPSISASLSEGQSRSVDGFRRVRSSTVGVPARNIAPARPAPRPIAASPVRRRRASVDGFGFV